MPSNYSGRYCCYSYSSIMIKQYPRPRTDGCATKMSVHSSYTRPQHININTRRESPPHANTHPSIQQGLRNFTTRAKEERICTPKSYISRKAKEPRQPYLGASSHTDGFTGDEDIGTRHQTNESKPPGVHTWKTPRRQIVEFKG